MSKISTYEVVPVPKLADKLIGTSVGGEIEDITYNFTLAELLNLFIPNIPSSTLQGVLDNGNSATQDIILDGTVYTTNLEVTDTATILNSYLNGDTHILGALYDVNNLKGTTGDVLSSTGTGVQWITLPPIFTPNLQQVLEVGNTADIDIILDANIEALDINVDTATINNNITIDGTITDGDSSVGTLNQVLSSTGTKVKWVNLPSYSATSPLFLDSITGVFSIQQSDNTHNGYLSYVDWITFNGKQPAGNYITALTGEATATGPGSVAISLSNPAVIGKVLSGLNVTGGSISATDSILTAFGKVQGQLNALVGGVMFKGVWNASTNNPTLTSSVGTQGWYYIVNVAGNTDLNGITDWQVGDWAIFNGSTWNKIDNTDLVTSVNGQTGAVSLTTDDISEGLTNLYFTDTRARNSVSATTPLAYNNISGVFSIQSANSSQNGYLSSTDWSTFNSKQNALSGTGLVKSTTGVISYITDNSSNWDIAYDNSIVSAAVTGTSVKTLTLNQQDGGTITATWSDANTGLTSVGLTMPAAFSVANSPLTSNGSLNVSAVGFSSQYIRGDGQLATFPSNAGGGSSVSYYLNGSIPSSVVGYQQMDNNAVIGAGTNFNLSGNGLIAQFLTDVGNPNRIQIPGGAWNFEMYFNTSSNGGAEGFYVELLKYDGVVFTSIASSSTNPEDINGGTSTDLYLTSLAVPTTTLLTTDRLAVRVYIVNNAGARTVTLHTEDNNLCEIITTFAGGIASLNGLTANTQYFAVGTSGTDFSINSLTDTHTFNLPTASSISRGALSSTDWTTFNNKADALSGTNNTVAKFNSSTTIGDSNIKDNGNAVSISTTAGSFGALQVGNYNGSILMNTANTSGGLIFQNTSSSNKLWDFSSYNNDINFNESGVPTPVMTLKSGGNIGINTITPSNRLDIIGTLGATGVVTLGNLAGSGNRMVIADSSGVLSTQVITTGTVTAVTASSPLASSGGNTPNITIQQSSGSQNGYLSSTDWTTFNNKQASGNYITSLTGEAIGTGPGATTVTLNNASVTGKVLTGINITGGTVVDTDSILTGFGKLQNQINGLIGGSIYQGTWNANTNTPTLTSGVGTKGYYYIVSVAGTTNLDGITDWFVGDWAIFDGTAWQQVDNTDAVVSVNGQTGAVSLTTDNIPEGTTNLYFLNSRARAALSFTAGSGAYNSTTGVITIPTNTSQLTNGANFITLASLSGTAPIGYNSSTGAISITQSGTSNNGYLSSTDWNTFNGKQNALTNPITGTGNANYHAKFTGSTTLGNSLIWDNGTNVGIGNTNTSYTLDVTGTGRFGSSSINTNYVYIESNNFSYLSLYEGYSTNTIQSSNTGAFTILNQIGVVSTNLLNYDYISKDLSFNTNGNNVRLTLSGAGNALIGSTVDDTVNKLQITGRAKVTGILTLGSTVTNGTYTYTLPSATGTLALTSALSGYLPLTGGTLTGALNGTEINASMPSGNGALYIKNSSLSSKNWTFIPNTNGAETDLLLFYTGAAAGTRLTLASTGAATFSGNVGIGGSPNNGLIDGLVIGNGTDNKGLTFFGTSTTQQNIAFTDIANTQQGLIQYDHGGDYLRFFTSSTEKVRITSGGNLLVGTTTDAGYKLDVNGTGRFTGALSGTSATFSNTTDVRVKTIGTTNLSLYESANASGSLYVGIDNSTASGFGVGNYSRVIWSSGTGYPLIFATQDVERIRITSGGNVGIGTTSPQTKLDIQGANTILDSYGLLSVFTTDGFAIDKGGQMMLGGYYTSVNQTAFGGIAARKENSTSGNYAGYLQFLSTTQGLGATEKMRITSGGNVGIGTTSPGAKLEVAASGAAAEIRINSNNTADNNPSLSFYSSFNSASERNWGMRSSVYALGDFAIFQSASANTSPFSGSSKLIISNAGNVLIGGTTDDGTKLNVTGSGKFSGNLQVGSGAGLSKLTVGNGAGYTGVVLNNSSTVYSWLLGSQYNINNGFEITPSTTIGGSTFTTPVFKILNTGAATFSSSVSVGGYLTGTGVNPGGLGGSRYLIDFSGNTSRLFSYGINNSTNGAFLFNSQRSDGTNSIDFLSIASTGAATFSSSVTSSFGSSGANFNSNAATTGAVNAYRVSNTTGVGSYGVESNAGGDLMTGGLSNATLLQSISNTALQFGTNQAARMTITSAGNVGIGTTSPLQVTANRTALTVNGVSTSIINLGIGDVLQGYWYAGGSSTQLWSSGRIDFNTGSATDMTFNPNNTERMRITSAGNVGIGTTSPSSLLQIAGGGTGTRGALRFSDAGLTNYWEIGRDNGTTGNFTFSSQASQLMTITSGGNVGIGTTSPVAKLSLNTNAVGLLCNFTDGIYQSFQVNTTSAGFDITNPNSGYISFSNTAERMRITSGGYTKISNNGTYMNSAGAYHEMVQTSNTNGNFYAYANSATYTGTNINSIVDRAATSAYYHIYTQSNGIQQFYVRGDGVIFAQNTTVQAISDVRTKENIVNSTEGLNIINALRPVRFDFKKGFGNDRKNQLGFIAQEVETVFPDAVDIWGESDDKNNPYKSIGTTSLIPILTKAVQELSAQIETLKDTLQRNNIK